MVEVLDLENQLIILKQLFKPSPLTNTLILGGALVTTINLSGT